MKNWIYPAVFAVALIIGLSAGFLLSNLFVVKPLTSSFGKQIDRKDELIVNLVKIPKNMIQNTLTVKKVKKGSNIYYVPSSDLQAVEIKMDSLFREFTPPDDTVNTPEKSFWEKLQFW
jgi:hypothetical protein